jgi:AraC-like DNA-binding protein
MSFMARAKFFLDTRRSKPGSLSVLKVAISHHDKTAYISLEARLLPEQWDSEHSSVVNHPDQKLLNIYINGVMQKVDRTIFILADSGNLATMTAKRHVEIFNRFCDLVVNNYRESREVKFYANLLNLTPKYLSKVILTTTDGLSPAKWIEQYVAAQAKRLIETHATQTLQEIAYLLGFSEPTSFYRYFKRATGMTAKEYRDSTSS